jgi:hypothetical protein
MMNWEKATFIINKKGFTGIIDPLSLERYQAWKGSIRH